MTDLVKGLRAEAEFDCLGPDCLNTQAANEIERLRGVLGAIEQATATGDGLSPKETVAINLAAHAAIN